ncbi:type I-U CRISPR-associated protein Csb2, partial [Streptomyces xiamenensis]|uniref:type I-G CRISPR-associated protein Csb2 n=1 Tax=Streptomyces xiamenensis TaxID=408015 RepID=UPI0035DCF07D
MTTLAFHFPHRRYHASPWNSYSTEAAVELPPSPWRIGRALYASWKLRHPHLPEAAVHPILTQLAALPDYHLPPYRLSATRHYQPDTQHRPGKTSTDINIDAFAILGADATIYATWKHAALTPDQHATLATLATSIPYLGRSESLVEAHLHTDPIPPTHTRSHPLAFNDTPTGNVGQVLALNQTTDLTVLTLRPTDIRAQRALTPPGTALHAYDIPRPDTLPTQRRSSRQAPREVTAVRLTVTGRPLPQLTKALPLIETLRARCIDILTGGHTTPPPRVSHLAGKDATHQPMRGHQHTHFIPHSTNGRHIHELILWIPGGLTPDELAAIEKATRGRTLSVPEHIPGPRDVHLRITAHGPAEKVLPPQLTTPST